MNEIRHEFYSEFDSLNITVREFNSEAYFLQAKVDVKTLFKAKVKRKYYIEINPKIYDCAPSPAALKAILIHELEHINDYNEMSSAQISELGVKYAASKKYRAAYERATDVKVLVKGQAQGLIEYRHWIYAKLSPRELELKKFYYLTPEEILTWVKEHN